MEEIIWIFSNLVPDLIVNMIYNLDYEQDSNLGIIISLGCIKWSIGFLSGSF